MARKVHELRDLRITRVALVRKGFRPVNDGARITIVKAEEDTMSDPTNAAAEASVLARISKALAGLLAKGEPEPVEKADGEPVADLEVGADGSHAAFDGTHSHPHVSHYAMMVHDHEHSHDGDGFHGHSHVEKADGDGARTHDLPDGWTLVSADELRTLLGTPAPVEKAEGDDNDAAVRKLIDQLSALCERLDAAQAKDEAEEDDEAVEKAQAAKLDEIVATKLEAALAPIAKSIEDFAVEFARQPRTANVTARIDPDAKPTAVNPAELEGLTFGDALRKLTRSRTA